MLDADGYLTMVDRIDMIIRGGENIYPRRSIGALPTQAALEAAVIGVPHEIYGEVPVANVVTYPQASGTVKDLRALCRSNLTKIKIPTAIHLVPELPKKPTARSTDRPARVALPTSKSDGYRSYCAS